MNSRLRQRITIQQNAPTFAVGVRTDNWLDVEQVYANIRTLSANERVVADSRVGGATHEIEMRYRENLGEMLLDTSGDPITDTSMSVILSAGDFTRVVSRYRIVYGGRIFDIRGVRDPDFRRRRLLFQVDESEVRA